LRLHWRELTPVCCQFDDPHFSKHGYAVLWEVGFFEFKKTVTDSLQPNEMNSGKNSGKFYSQ